MLKNVLIVIFCSTILANLNAQISAKLIQYPDVSEEHICFTFGDDLWLVPKEGGDAYRIISPTGRETTPRFSPDGKSIAYVANYDGNNDIYTLPIKGGVPNRVTGHGMFESLQEWSADGKRLLYASSAESGKQRWAQFYMINKEGGLPQKHPVELGANASVSADGKMIAFTDKSRVNRNWKRYRGGTAPDITIMNLETLDSENITQNDANDEVPMWYGELLYYLSDKDQNMRNNIWVYDTKSKTHVQLTFFEDFDVHYPSIGPSDLVYEAGGEIYLMDLKTNASKVVSINAVGDFTRIRPVSKQVGKYASFFDLSPDGNWLILVISQENMN